MNPAATTTSPLFRESALRHFEKPEQQEAVRVFGALLSDLIGEAGGAVLDSGDDAPAESWRRDASGAVADLRQAQEELSAIAGLLEDAGQGEEGARRLVAFSDAAAAVEEIVAGLDSAIARFAGSAVPQ